MIVDIVVPVRCSSYSMVFYLNSYPEVESSVRGRQNKK